MDTNKSKVSVRMLSTSKAEFVLVSSIVIMHISILSKIKDLERLAIHNLSGFWYDTHTFRNYVVLLLRI